MQSLESGVRSTVDSIHHELRGTDTRGRGPKAPTNARGPVATDGAKASAPKPPSSARKEGAATDTIRGLVLEFATKMRQSRRGEVLSSC